MAASLDTELKVEKTALKVNEKKKRLVNLSFDDAEYKANSFSSKMKSSHDALQDPKLSKQSLSVDSAAPSTLSADEASSAPSATFQEGSFHQLIENSSKLAQVKLEVEKVRREILNIQEKKEEEESTRSKSFVEQQKNLYKKNPNVIIGKRRKNDQDDTQLLHKLLQFRDKLRGIEPEDDESDEEKKASKDAQEACKLHAVINCKSCKDTFGLLIEQNEQGWLAHKLVFEKEVGHKDLKNDPYQLMVIDPRIKPKN